MMAGGVAVTGASSDLPNPPESVEYPEDAMTLGEHIVLGTN
jgi:hypothetical protein